MIMMSLLLSAGGDVLYSIDFGKESSGDAIPQLKKKGFEFLLDSSDLNLKIANGRLELETEGKKAGLFGLRLSKPLQNVGKVLIEWGVEKFPEGADWKNGNNRLAIGAIFVLGKEKFPSGVPFVDPVPYFLAPFIGQKEQVGKMYLGKLYRKAGRYYCLYNKTGPTTSTFNIDQKFKEAFGNKKSPPLTAFAFQMNTKNTTGGAKAFIKKITFYSAK